MESPSTPGSEATVFLSCLTAVNQLRSLASAYEVGEITRVAFSRQATRIVADLSELADATERFDVVLPVIEFGKFSASFWRWFNWWSDKDHRPKCDWISYRSTPAFALVIT
jgi:hypothetical protein